MNMVFAFGTGGTERQFVSLGLALEPSRVAVQFGCLRRMGELLPEIHARGIPVLDYNVWTFRHPRVAGAQLRLARDIRRHGIQIVHTYSLGATLFAIPAAKLAGARVIASIRGLSVYLSPLEEQLQRIACRFADRILVNASAIRDWLVSTGYDARRIAVIPNGIDLTRFKPRARTGNLHRALGTSIEAPLIGVVGRVMRFKGIEDFLRAAAIVADRFPAARFVIVGEPFTMQGRGVIKDNTYQNELARFAAELGLQNKVLFTGFRADVENVLPDLSISVQTSLSEGLSNSLLESMAVGVPVVATRVGGTAEAVKDGEDGLLVPPADPVSLAEALSQLLAQPTLATRLGEAGRRAVMERFSMEQMVETTTRFYESLLEQNGRVRPDLVKPLTPLRTSQ